VLVDRTTVHLQTRTLSEQPGYFSIYRTAEEVKAIFTAAGWALGYRAPSYVPLNFSYPIRRVLGSRPVCRMVTATAPASFAVLRAWARARRACFGVTGELAGYSHEFFLCRRPAGTRAS
jgi:hypothetical protein